MLREIDRYSAENHMDRATMLRNLIERGLNEEKMNKVMQGYKERKYSLQKAASLLGLDITEMISLIQKEGLYLDYDGQQLKDDLKGFAR